ncbi:unnamed protein product [Brachionus calyciflorus]|uniref:Uncharacterized protein n=1 Tax=Brachionus calyciflorus TaxID=104777 RepID=A0A813QQ96_9BILA|nr:unnamed protein product [Brachionus calyciflorus]
MSSSVSILENNFDGTANDAEEITKNLRKKAKIYDFLEQCESFEEFKRKIKEKLYDNVSWNFHSTIRLSDKDKHVFSCKYNKAGCKKTIYLEIKSNQISGDVHISDNLNTNHPEEQEEESSSVPILVKQKIIEYRKMGQKKRNIKKIF